MKIQTLETAGIPSALHAMRNPMDSWDKTDSTFTSCPYMSKTDFAVGKADKELSMKLQHAGPEHCKHLRMVMVWANITAPRYWWTEFDTYRIGVEKVSCSTMHKLMSRELTMDDFAFDDKENGVAKAIVDSLNTMMFIYKDLVDPDSKKEVWRLIIQCLPQAYIQKRTVMMSYAALRNIYHQREGHKLKEWQAFREWVESLPESWMITE